MSTPASSPRPIGPLVAVGVGVLLIVALVVTAVVVTPMLLASPPKAELRIAVAGADGKALGDASLTDAAAVVSGRLAAEGIPHTVSVADGGVLVRLDAEATDADLAAAEQLAAFTTAAEFRPVIAAGPCRDDLPPPPTERGEMIDCDADGIYYELGPAEIRGTSIADARASERAVPGSDPQWSVLLELDAEGTAQLAELTGEAVATGDQFAIVVDGAVLMAPQVMAAITDGSPEISGTFDQAEAELLAARLRLAADEATLLVEWIDIPE